MFHTQQQHRDAFRRRGSWPASDAGAMLDPFVCVCGPYERDKPSGPRLGAPTVRTRTKNNITEHVTQQEAARESGRLRDP